MTTRRGLAVGSLASMFAIRATHAQEASPVAPGCSPGIAAALLQRYLLEIAEGGDASVVPEIVHADFRFVLEDIRGAEDFAFWVTERTARAQRLGLIGNYRIDALFGDDALAMAQVRCSQGDDGTVTRHPTTRVYVATIRDERIWSLELFAPTTIEG